MFTVRGAYTSRGWTEWTQGFQFGSAILQFDATGEREFLEIGRKRTVALMASHVSHIGVHDHGFNNVSTYGNLLRLAREGRIDASEWEQNFYRMALKVSGAVQARRWTAIRGGGGYIYSFNGPHSLFVDTIRSLRALGVAHIARPRADGRERPQDLAARPADPARARHRRSTRSTTAKAATPTTFAGARRTSRSSTSTTATTAVPNSQQGYSPFSTWTRGLAWAMLGFAEQLEFLETLADGELEAFGGRAAIEGFLRKAALATCDFYIDNTRRRRHPVLGHRRAGSGADGRLSADASRRSVQRARAGGHLGGRHRRAGAAAAGHGIWKSTARAEAARALLAGRSDRCSTPVRRAVPEHRRTAPGPDSAFGLSPAERLGSRAGGPQSALRRIEHVGRLPRPRGGALSRARDRRREDTTRFSE